MSAALSLTYILEKLVDLLPLTREQLGEMSAKELRDDVAKILGISKAYQLKKAQLLDACWQALENVQNQLQIDEAERKEGKEALQRLKKNDDYIVPVTTVAAYAYKRLRDVAQKGANLQEMKESVNGLVATIARGEMRKFKFSTVKTRRVDVKEAMQAMVDSEIPLLKETMQFLLEYFYNQLLSFQRDDSEELSKTYRQKVKGKNTAKTPIEITSLVEDCQGTLEQLMNGEEPHWTKVSAAAALGMGRRMAEIHSLGSFEVAGDYTLHFTGQAKTRGAEDAKTDYTIPTLFRAATLKRAIDYLEEKGRRLDPEEQKRDRNAVNKAYAMALSRAVDKYPGISYKGLRAIYAECQWALLPDSEKATTSQHRKYSDWLGHIDKDGSIDTTFVSYMVYNVTDIEAVKRQLRK
jgi:hypothetical protein